MGGARSGKSRLAQELAEKSNLPFAYLATGVVTDEEMEERVSRHRQQRPACWTTFEVRGSLRGVTATFPPGVLLDCVTFLVSTHLLQGGGEEEVLGRVRDELDWLFLKRERERFFLIVVSNEVGQGVVPEHPLGRVFRDVQGRINQWIAGRCDEVVFVVAGLPWILKSF